MGFEEGKNDFSNLVVLHIAHMEAGAVSGVSSSVIGHVLSQEGRCSVGLLNVSSNPIEVVPGVSNYFSGLLNTKISQLGEPFNKPDLVVFHELYRPPFLGLAKELKRNCTPYVVVPHGCLTQYAQSSKRLKKRVANLLLFESFLKGAASVQYLSDRESRCSAFQLPYFVVPNGTSRTFEKTSFSEEGFKGVYVGRLDIEIKGLDLLIEAISKCRETFEREAFRFELYGPGDAVALRALISEYGVGGLVEVFPAVFDDEKKAVLLSADCFIQPSRSEGLPMGLIEAMALGLPCIVTDGTGMKDVVEEFDMGWGCETSAESIAYALCRVIDSRHKLPQYSKQASDFAKSKYAWSKISDDSLRAYARLLGLSSHRCE